MNFFRKLTLPALALLILSACSQDFSNALLYEKPGYRFPYEITRPDGSWNLPAVLTEISGISFIDHEKLACIQDEKGSIFIFNTTTGMIEDEIPFGDKGDYEDLAIIGRDAWILKSNGTLYEFRDFRESAGSNARKYPTFLSSANDAEGLAYDAESNSLLIACKEEPYYDGTINHGIKAIYRFGLSEKSAEPMPWRLISLDSLKAGKNFKPSGIAIQPETGHLFILASAGKALLVISKQGMILAEVRLDQKHFPQPEGICFGPEGTLYISSEGDGREGRIFRFIP